MTDPARHQQPRSSEVTRRGLNPGGGAILRRTYTKLLTVSIAATAAAWILAVAVTVTSAGNGNALLLVLSFLLVGGASVCLLLSVARGRAAVDGDQVEMTALRTSARLARAGSLTGWLGALIVAVTGLLLHLRGVDNAVMVAVVLAAAVLVLGVCNDATHRIGKRLADS